MTSNIVEGFSLSHAGILTSAGVPADFGDIYGVRTGSISVDTGNYDNTGDDAVLSSWFWFNFATVTIQSGYVPFSTIALLSGSTITSSGSGVNDYYSLPLWEERSLNQPTRSMVVRVPAKDKDGLTRTLDFILFKVQFGPFSFDGPSYKSGLLLNYTGRAVMSDTDERGNALVDADGNPARAIGRLVSRPYIVGGAA